MPKYRRKAWLSSGILIALMVGAILAVKDGASPSLPGGVSGRVQSEPSPTATSPIYYGWPIMTAAEAISRTLTRFPEGHSPHSEVARLISMSTLLDGWFAGEVGTDDADPAAPVWLVGVLGEGLTAADTIDFPWGTGAISDTTPVDGMYYAWEADTGFPVASGALISGTAESYENLVQLPDEQIPIEQPTLEHPWWYTPPP